MSPELLPFEVLNALAFTKLFIGEELTEIADALTDYGLEPFPLRGVC